jgi:gliding motility-associated-like protein
MKTIYILILLLSISLSDILVAQNPTVTATVVHATCPANGEITAIATGGSIPYTYKLECLTNPLFNTQVQSTTIFGSLDAGTYRLTITGKDGKSTSIFVVVNTTYIKLLLDSVKLAGSDAQLFGSLGKSPFEYTYVRNGILNKPFSQDSVLRCLPNGTYQFRIYDACNQYYSQDGYFINIPDVYFNSTCSYDSSGTSISLTTFSGGEAPYRWLSISNFGDTILSTNGNFKSLKGCNFDIYVYDKCNRVYKRNFDCPPANMNGYIECSNTDIGTATLRVNGGTPPYNYLETNSGQSNTTGLFDTLPANKAYNFVITDKCGRSLLLRVNPLRYYSYDYVGCPYTGNMNIIFGQFREGGKLFFPYTVSCKSVTPNQILIDSTNYNWYLSFNFKNIPAGKHHFTITNGCGEMDSISVQLDSALLYLNYSVSCDGGVLTAYTNLGDNKTTFYILDEIGNTLDSNKTGIFTNIKVAKVKIKAVHPDCLVNIIDANLFANPYSRVRYISCDSVFFEMCPKVSGYTYFLFDKSKNLLKTDTVTHFENLMLGTDYVIGAIHPLFKDTIWQTFYSSYVPNLYKSTTTCSSICAAYDSPYSWVDQHGSKVLVSLLDSLGNVLMTQNDNLCFYNLQSSTKYTITVKHPYCGFKKIDITTLPAIKPSYCLFPFTALKPNKQCTQGWNINADERTVTSFKLYSSLLKDTLYNNAGDFNSLLPGRYYLETECTKDTIDLPVIEDSIWVKSGPACPRVASLQVYGAKTGSNWGSILDSFKIKLCGYYADQYYLYDASNKFLTSNGNGYFDFLNPGEEYKIYLVRNGCIIDSTTHTTDYYIRPDLFTFYGAICNNATTGSIKCKATAGRPPYIYEILKPTGYPPVSTNDTFYEFKNLPPGSYELRVGDACGISAGFTGTIGPLNIIPRYTQYCDGKLKIETPAIDNATYKWLDTLGNLISNNREIWFDNNDNGKVLKLVVNTKTGCLDSTVLKIDPFQSNSTKAKAGTDQNVIANPVWLNAIPTPLGFSGRWDQISPSSGTTSFIDINNPKTSISVTQFPGLYTYQWTVIDSTTGCISIDTMQVVFCKYLDSLNLISQLTNSSCIRPTGTISINIVGSSNPIKYNWSTGDTTQNIKNLLPGNYQLTIIDSRKCISNKYQNFQINVPIISTNVTKQDLKCNNVNTGIGNVNANGGTNVFNYIWSDGKIGNIRNDLKATKYFVTSTDSEGCNKIDSILLTEPPLIYTFQKDTLCFGSKIRVGIYQHESTGIYLDTLKAKNGCDSIIKTDLYVKPLSKSTLDSIICSGEILNIGNKNYNTSGNYIDTLKTYTGCDSVVFTNLQVLKLNGTINSKPKICNPNGYLDLNANSNLSNNPISYLWSNGSKKNKIDSLNYGIYYVTISQGRCSIVLNGKVDSIANMIRVGIVKKDLTCPNDSTGAINLVVNGFKDPFQIIWNTNDTTTALNQVPKGVYKYIVTDNNGCKNIDSITIQSPDPFSMKVLSKDISCYNFNDGSIDMMNPKGGTKPYTFSLNSIFDTIHSYQNLSANTYNLSLKDDRGCIYNQKIVLKQPEQLQVNIECDTIVDLGKDVNINSIINSSYHAPLFYKWKSSASLSCDSCSITSAQSKSRFKVFLFTKDAHNCTSIDSIQIRVEKFRPIYIPNVFSPNNDGSNDKFNIHGDKSLKIIRKLLIYNRWGTLVFEGTNLTPNNDSEGWDGTFKSQILDPDVFVYYTELEWIDGKLTSHSGDITLIR